MIEMFSRFEPLLAPEDMGGGGESGVEVQDVAEPETEVGVEEQEPAEPVESKSDASFAKMRRELEALQKEKETWSQKEAEWNETRDEYEEALGRYFQGENKAAQAIAHYDEIPLEQVVNDMKARRELNGLRAENKRLADELNAQGFENAKAKDLAEIKAAFPDADITDVMDIENFAQFRAMGIEASKIYEAHKMKQGNPPKSIGKVKASVPTKDTFTKAEVDAMSPKDRIKNFDKIRASMAKW